MCKSFFLLLMFAVTISAIAQKQLLVKSSNKGLYLEHKVSSKESFYSVGRLYNVGPKFLASYNKIDLSKGLQIDQKLKVPLTDTNFSQSSSSDVPLYYKVGDGEGLSVVSKKMNGVKISSLKSWNNLSGDVIKKDARMIVGFLKGAAMEPAAGTIKTSAEETAPKIEEAVEEVKPEKKPEIKVDNKPIEESKPVVKPEEKNVIKAGEGSAVNNEGYFKAIFERQVKITPISKDETVTAGIFKTVSGFQDFKYYVLLDKVSPSTIVKLTNPSNNKTVYAKVMGEMSGIRQNAGFTLRMSNAASAALGIMEDDKFIVKLSY